MISKSWQIGSLGLIIGLQGCQDSVLSLPISWMESPLVTCQQGSTEEQQNCLQESIHQSYQEQQPLQEMIAYCTQLSVSLIQEECYFLIADEYQLIEQSALDLCSQTGTFQEDCLRHASARHVEMQLFPQLHNAKPLKVMPRIYGIVQQYLPDEIAQPMARDMMLRYASTQVSAPFTMLSCQDLGKDLCAQVYILSSLGSRSQIEDNAPWLDKCGQPITQMDAKLWGWMTWTRDDNTAQVVQMAFEQLCQRQQ